MLNWHEDRKFLTFSAGALSKRARLFLIPVLDALLDRNNCPSSSCPSWSRGFALSTSRGKGKRREEKEYGKHNKKTNRKNMASVSNSDLGFPGEHGEGSEKPKAETERDGYKGMVVERCVP